MAKRFYNIEEMLKELKKGSKKKGWHVPYRGITYPAHLQTKKALAKWKKEKCPQDMHLFDEVGSSEHYLHCDACGLMVHIAYIETSKQACKRVENNEEPPPFVIKARKSNGKA